jgi:hypothetical protein
VQYTEFVERLTQLAETRNLAEVAIESCRKFLNEARRESEKVGEVFCGGRDAADLVLKWRRHALVFNHRFIDYPFIESCVDISVPDEVCFEGLRPIGIYRLITHLESGQPDDDCLEWRNDPDSTRSKG